MSVHDRLLADTAAERARFLSVPVIAAALEGKVSRATYLAFLGQAYHHVRQTCPLLGLALARTDPCDAVYRRALIGYIDEEKGHEEWILDDIRALGGDAEAVRGAVPGVSCRAMVAYATWAVEHLSPYALLGMVHVLEGMSVALADGAARGIAGALALDPRGPGFGYLTSHGALDREHVRFFVELVDGIDDTEAYDAMVDTANVVYRLYGGMFAEIDAAGAVAEAHDAA